MTYKMESLTESSYNGAVCQEISRCPRFFQTLSLLWFGGGEVAELVGLGEAPNWSPPTWGGGVMWKVQLLYALVLIRISKTRVLSEVEKDSVITLPGKGGYSRLMPPEPCVPTWG